MEFKRCPCGQIPPSLVVVEGETSKWAYVSPGCCGEWYIEFRINYNHPKSQAAHKLAVEAWNDAPRADEIGR